MSWFERRQPTLTPDQRARDLLFQILTPEERRRFIMTKRIEITGSQGGRYRLTTDSQTGNITPLTEVKIGSYGGIFGKRAGPNNRLCAHPSPYTRGGDRLPLLDAIATQVLVIKVDEGKFLRTALIYY